MADELKYLDAAGKTLYAKPLPLVASPWGTDAVSLTDSGSVGYYKADVASPAAQYAVYVQVGGSAASTDGPAIATIQTDAALYKALLDRATSNHTSSGTVGKAIGDAATSSAAAATSAASAATSANTAASNASSAVTAATAASTAATAAKTAAEAVPSASANASATATAILVTPANKIKTNASNQVEMSNATSPDLSGVTAAIAAVDTKVTALPTAAQNADALLDRTDGAETGRTPRELFRAFFAFICGKTAGAGTNTQTVTAAGGAKTRLTYTSDNDGNITGVTLDLTAGKD